MNAERRHQNNSSLITHHSSLVFKTAWGWMGIAASANRAGAGICRIVLPHRSRRTVEAEIVRRRTSGVNALGKISQHLTSHASPLTPVLREARRQLTAFLEGKRRSLDVPVDLSQGSPFQRKVWRAALRIPYGRVRSYKWVATKVGGKHYARAVGLALGANPVPIVVPCHRVVAHDGSLGGFSCGLPAKRRLLTLEGTFSQLKS